MNLTLKGVVQDFAVAQIFLTDCRVPVGNLVGEEGAGFRYAMAGLDGGRLAIGAPADLVLFDPDAPFILDRFALRSKSKNTPFDGARMEGRVIGTWVGGRRVFGEGVAAEARA